MHYTSSVRLTLERVEGIILHDHISPNSDYLLTGTCRHLRYCVLLHAFCSPTDHVFQKLQLRLSRCTEVRVAIELSVARNGGTCRGEFRPRQNRQLPRAVDLKGWLLSCQSY